MNQRITAGKSSIAWDNEWRCIEVNGAFLYLTPTQYRICRTFLVASETTCRLDAGKFVILAFQPCGQLLDELGLSRTSLIRHMSDINTRLVPIGLEFCSFQDGYMLCFSTGMIQKIRQ
jgi:hypothetical protein